MLFAQEADIDALQKQIQSRERQIQQLEKEIAQHKQEIRATSAERQTLQNKVAELEATQRKLETELSVTQNRIAATNLTIQQINLEIEDAEESIGQSKASVAQTIRTVHKSDEVPLVEALLQYKSLSDMWTTVAELQRVQENLRSHVRALETFTQELAKKKGERVEEKESLVSLQSELSHQEDIVEYNKEEQEVLLSETQNKEAEYQRLLQTKQELRAQFEQELNNLESQLQIAIDKSKFPDAGTRVFVPPLEDMSLESCWGAGSGYRNCVTQYFGNTAFAQSGAYNGQGHNGADFRAPIGDKLLSPADGIIRGVGDTDIGGCVSYGKWILVEHPNGLSNAFGHLSKTIVQEGQRVSAGEVIGYTGNTGYSTGPHLHMSTFATEGVDVVSIGEWYIKNGRTATTPCARANIRIPVAPHEAYLDPFNYL